MGSRNIIKLLIGISAGWILICAAIIGIFVYAEMNKPQWQRDADKAADLSETDSKLAAELYDKALKEALAVDAPVPSRLELMEKKGDALYGDGQYLEAKSVYHAASLIAQRSCLLIRQSDFLICEARAWHEAFKLGLVEIPDAAIVKTALGLRARDEELPNSTVQMAHQALAEIAADHEQFDQSIAFYRKALSEASSLEDGGAKREARLGMIAVAITQRKYKQGNDIFVEGVDDKDGDANLFRSNYLALMLEASAAESEDEAVKSELQELLQERKFAELDRFFSGVLKVSDELPSGLLLSDTYLCALADCSNESPEERQKKIDTLTAWNKQFPRSQAARLILSDALVNFSLLSKSGSDSADVKTDSPEMVALFERAKKVLDDEQIKTPGWYRCYVTVLLNFPYDAEKIDQLTVECQNQFPRYKQIVFLKAASLLPEQHGTYEECEKYIAAECKKLDSEKSDVMYAQSAMYLETYATDDVLVVAHMDWQRTRRGLQDLIGQNKDWLIGKTMLSVFATEMNDSKIAGTAF